MTQPSNSRGLIEKLSELKDRRGCKRPDLQPSSVSLRRIGFESNLPSTIPLTSRKRRNITPPPPSFPRPLLRNPLFPDEDDRFKYSRELDYGDALECAIPRYSKSCVSADGEDGKFFWDTIRGKWRVRCIVRGYGMDFICSLFIYVSLRVVLLLYRQFMVIVLNW